MVKHDPVHRTPYPAEKARGAEIILKRPWQRYVFFGGLIGIVLLVLILRLASLAAS
jgi:hypothetical protein